jgi:uncharacterized protein
VRKSAHKEKGTMRVIITGGSGFIGRALSASLASDGHEVIALTRKPEAVRGLPGGMRAVGWDARSGEGWSDLADGAEAIVNLAGENLSTWPWTTERKLRFRDSRVNAGRAVVDAVRRARAKPRVVVQASGVGYYGPRGGEEIPENSAPGADFLARLAVDWEASSAEVEALGVRRAIIRTGLPLSLHGGAFPLMRLPFLLMAGGPLGNGRQALPWIHLEDEVRAIRFLIGRPDARGPFNLAAPQPVTHRQFARTLGKLMRRPSILPTPAFALRLVLGEMASVLLTGQRAVPARLAEMGFAFKFVELEDALRDVLEG